MSCRLQFLCTLICAAGVAFFNACVMASVVEYEDKSAWISAVSNNFTTISFTELPANTFVTTQYSGVGAVFTDGIDITNFGKAYLNDNLGLNGVNDSITIEFAQSISWIAIDFPGAVKYELYLNDNLIYTSSNFVTGALGSFAGLLSDQPFDEARIFDPIGGVFIDDLFFGPPIHAPGAIGVLLIGALSGRRRRQ